MASNWTTYKVGDLFDLQNGFAFKGTDFIEKGVPVIKIKNVKAGKILLNDLSYVSRDVADKAKRFFIKPNDILITMSGNRMDGSPETWVGKVALFHDEGEYLLNQRVGILRPKENADVNVDFCAYALSSWEYQNHFITAANSSGGQANISPSIISDTEIILPNRETQDEIAATLRALDDKIKNNEAILFLSEQIARSIYKEWFIDFRFPNHDGETIETDFGEIPKDWRVAKVGELVDTISETYKFGSKKEIIFLNTSDISDGQVLNFDYSDVKGLPGQAKKRIKRGDILYSEIRPENKRYAFIDFNAENFVVSTKLMVLRSKKINPLFVYFFLTSNESIKELQHLAESRSGTFPQITFSQLKELGILIPHEALLNEFIELLEIFYDSSANLIEENKKIQEIKKEISPKLLLPENELA